MKFKLITGVFCLGLILQFLAIMLIRDERDKAKESSREASERLYNCGEALHDQEIRNDELRLHLADMYYEKADEIFDCAEQVCAANGWIAPTDWYDHW